MKKLIFLLFIAIVMLGGYVYLQYNNLKEYQVKSVNKIEELQNRINKYKVKTKVLEKQIKDVEERANKKVQTKELKKDVLAPKHTKDVVIKVPKVPEVTVKVPKVITIGGSKIKAEKETHLSMDMPVEKVEKKESVTKNDSNKSVKLIGVEQNGRISAYLRTKLNKDAQKTLEKSGFKVLKVVTLNSNLKTIIFTNKEIKNMALNSAYFGSLRALIDTKSKTMSIQNPLYFGKAFLMDKYSEDKATNILKNINSAFNNLTASSDMLKSSLLPKYQFMFGMPYYSDMITLKKAKSSKEIVDSIDKSKLAFIEQIDNNSYLLGVNLPANSASFINKIGTKNAMLLPYPVIVKNGVAKMLNPKYYIAISYPMLKMSQFMKISDVPEQIENDIKAIIK